MKLVNSIACAGILEKKDFEEVKCYDIFKQIITYNLFEIPPLKPEAESICNVTAQAVITRWRIIDSIHGKKIVFHGEIRITVTYVANKPEQPVHSVHFIQNFYGYIKCDVLCNNICDSFKIKTFIEDIESCLVSERKIAITSIVLVVVKNCCIKECHEKPHCDNDDHHDGHHCEEPNHDGHHCEENHNEDHHCEENHKEDRHCEENHKEERHCEDVHNEQGEGDIRNRMKERKKEK